MDVDSCLERASTGNFPEVSVFLSFPRKRPRARHGQGGVRQRGQSLLPHPPTPPRTLPPTALPALVGSPPLTPVPQGPPNAPGEFKNSEDVRYRLFPLPRPDHTRRENGDTTRRERKDALH